MTDKTKRVLWIVIAAALVAAAILLSRKPGPSPEEGASGRSASPGIIPEFLRGTEPPRAEPVRVEPPPPPEPQPPEIIIDADTGEEARQISAAHILAVVNGVAVSGRDLLLFGRGSDPAQAMSPDQYDYLLNRAIERELIFQQAKSKGVELGEPQQKQLEQVRATVLAREAGDPNVVYLTHEGTLEEQVAFELREATAQLLKNVLLEQAGVAPPFVSAAQVREHYELNREAYGPLPEDTEEHAAAWAAMDYRIRGELTPSVQSTYQSNLDQYMRGLKAAADIRVYVGDQ